MTILRWFVAATSGSTARAKLSTSFWLAAAVAIVLVFMDLEGGYSTRLMVPFIKFVRPRLSIPALLHIPHLGALAFLPFILFVMLIIVGSSNAVNLTDGLDGLAIGCTIIAAGALTVLTYVSGHVIFADYLELQRMPMVSEVTVFCGAMSGRQYRIPLVQRASGRDLYGRRGFAGAGRRDRHGRGGHQAGAAAAFYRWSVS